MIERYQNKEINTIWSDTGKFKLWRDIEIAVCEAWAKRDIIPADALEQIKTPCEILPEKVYEIEKKTQHETIAFLTAWKEIAGIQDAGKYIHYGLTSSDMLDTALSLQIKESYKLIQPKIKKLLITLKNIACQYKYTPIIGRTHGIHGEVTTFGLKIANFYNSVNTTFKKLEEEHSNLLGMFSGAVGNYNHIDRSMEKEICELLELKPTSISSQVIAREYHANLLAQYTLLTNTIERMAVEFRLLQKTDTIEIEEPFNSGQKGSSAMPHKRNPWRSENLTGMARLMRSYLQASLENTALWHERDMSHSSVERVIFPDAFHVLSFMLDRIVFILDGLNIYTDNMLDNINVYGGIVHSQQLLLGLINQGNISREEAYNIVQKLAHKAWNHPAGNFKKLVLKSQEITNILSNEQIEECFTIKLNIPAIDEVFNEIW